MHLSGLLFFPVTPFDPNGAVDEARLRLHVAERVGQGAGAVFAACGTGEFNTLTTPEILAVARTAVAAAQGSVPVFSGVGGPLATGRDDLAALEDAGVAGVLLLPPYLVKGPQPGVVRYVETIASRTSLPVIAYQRATMTFTPESAAAIAAIPNVIGLKDGVGDLAAMQAIVSEVRRAGHARFQFFNGLPTAEISARAYSAIDVALYSSAAFAFAPDIALAFHGALNGGDAALVDALLQDFFVPFARIRDRQPGYAVSLVKAAATIAGAAAGAVRAPLSAPAAADLAELQALIAAVRPTVAVAA